MKEDYRGYIFPEKATSGLKHYADLNELHEKNPELTHIVGYVPYEVHSLQRLIMYNLEIADGIFSVDRGYVSTKSYKYSIETVYYETSYEMRIENNSNSKILDILFYVRDKDGAHLVSMCLYNASGGRILRHFYITGEIAEYINILIAKRSQMKASDGGINNSVKNVVFGIEYLIHEALKK